LQLFVKEAGEAAPAPTCEEILPEQIEAMPSHPSPDSGAGWALFLLPRDPWRRRSYGAWQVRPTGIVSRHKNPVKRNPRQRQAFSNRIGLFLVARFAERYIEGL
jgi:hypothetical protein